MTEKSRISRVAWLVAAGFLVAACTSEMRDRPKETAGAVIGAIGGGLAGAQFGGGKGTVVTAIIGTLLGGWLGSEAGKSLDRADQEHAQSTARQTLEQNPPGQTSRWYNPESGNSGTVTPAETRRLPSGLQCRDFESSITIDGRLEKSRGLACKQEDGSWRIAHTVPVAMTPTEAFVTQSGHNCRDFEGTFTIDGRVEETLGLACQQPDGTWRVSRTVPAPVASSKDGPECRDIQSVMIDGRAETVSGSACRQPDGTWRVMQ
jgi:surface antigen